VDDRGSRATSRIDTVAVVVVVAPPPFFIRRGVRALPHERFR
jgi:hypothetical protein